MSRTRTLKADLTAMYDQSHEICNGRPQVRTRPPVPEPHSTIFFASPAHMRGWVGMIRVNVMLSNPFFLSTPRYAVCGYYPHPRTMLMPGCRGQSLTIKGRTVPSTCRASLPTNPSTRSTSTETFLRAPDRRGSTTNGTILIVGATIPRHATYFRTEN